MEARRVHPMGDRCEPPTPWDGGPVGTRKMMCNRIWAHDASADALRHMRLRRCTAVPPMEGWLGGEGE